MTNYEKIKAIINSGCMAYNENEGRYIVFSSITRDELIRVSGLHSLLKGALDNIGKHSVNEEYINDMDIANIRPLGIKPPLLKVGDMVEILEVTRECGDYEFWCESAKEMVGKGPFIIKDVYDDSRGIYYEVGTKDKSDWWLFPHYTVCWTGEVEPEIIEINGKKYLKSDIDTLNPIE